MDYYDQLAEAEFQLEIRDREEPVNKRSLQRHLLIFAAVFCLLSCICGVVAMTMSGWILGSLLPGVTVKLGLWEACFNGIATQIAQRLWSKFKKENKVFFLGGATCRVWEDLPNQVWALILGMNPDVLYTARYLYCTGCVCGGLTLIMILVALVAKWYAMGIVLVLLPYFCTTTSLMAAAFSGYMAFEEIKGSLEAITIIGPLVSSMFYGYSLYLAIASGIISALGLLLALAAQTLWRQIHEREQRKAEEALWIDHEKDFLDYGIVDPPRQYQNPPAMPGFQIASYPSEMPYAGWPPMVPPPPMGSPPPAGMVYDPTYQQFYPDSQSVGGEGVATKEPNQKKEKKKKNGRGKGSEQNGGLNNEGNDGSRNIQQPPMPPYLPY
eukprot:Filipodium_phascolosomae@DN858_c0_g1_i1.p1